MKSDSKILEKELSYKIYGLFLEVGKQYGCFYREEIYQKACEERLEQSNLLFKSKPKVFVNSKITNKELGFFIPDLIVEDKIIVEIKVVKALLEKSINQLVSYLKESKYEVGYLVNFGTSYTQIIRRVYSNEYANDANTHELSANEL